MEEIHEFDIKLTTEDRNLLILALVRRRENRIYEYPCFSNPSCESECPVLSHGIKCSQHSNWLSEIKRINDLLNKIEDLTKKEVEG